MCRHDNSIGKSAFILPHLHVQDLAQVQALVKRRLEMDDEVRVALPGSGFHLLHPGIPGIQTSQAAQHTLSRRCAGSWATISPWARPSPRLPLP